MKTKGVIGQRIVAIRQTRFFNERMGRMSTSVDAIELENGRRIYAIVEELEGDYAVDFGVTSSTKRRKKIAVAKADEEKPTLPS